MVRLRQLRVERSWTLEQMAEKLKVSIATLVRIETKERQHQKHPMDEKKIVPFLAALNKTFKQHYTLDDLEGVQIAPPRPGRPKKQAESKETK